MAPAPRFDTLLGGLVAAYGPPGRETGIRAALRRALRGLGRLREDVTGNLHLHVPARGPKLLLAAHMDAPGLIVTRVEASGLGRVALLGGSRAAEWIGATIVLDGGTRGVIAWDRPKDGKDAAEPEADQLSLHLGVTGGAARKRIATGSIAALDDRLERLGDLWVAGNLDNRAGCAAVVAAVRAVRRPRFDLHVVFSAQSDLGARGAATGAYGIDPDLAIVLDVASVEDGTGGGSLGKGPFIGLKEEGYLAHPKALDLLRRSARAGRVPTQWLIRESGGSDARTIRAARGGVPTAVVALPARRSGGPRSMIHAKDLTLAVRLLTRLVQTPYSVEA